MSSPDADIEIAPWGDPSAWRDFFQERQLRRDFAASLTLKDPCVYVSHGDFECQMASPRMDGERVSFLSYPWVHPSAGLPHGRLRVAAALSTDLDESDVILGGAKKLDALLASVARGAPAGCLVALVPDCVPLLTGEDVEGIVRRRAPALGERLVYLNLAADPRATLFEKLFAKFHGGGRRRAARGRVNLVGFPDVAGTRELIGLLAGLGVLVNARLLPDFSVAEIRRWDGADLQVLLPHRLLEAAFERAALSAKGGRTRSEDGVPMAAAAGRRAVAPPAPYGLAGTRRWLEAVLAAAGKPRLLREAWPRLSADAEAGFRRAKSRLRGRSVILVDDALAVARYSDPCRTFGVPLLPVLREMGVGVRFALYRAPGKARPPRRGVRWFSSPRELGRILRGEPCRAVFSNVFFDRRITRAGKTPFSLSIFEMGLAGAVRSLRRMDGVTSLDFYEKNAP